MVGGWGGGGGGLAAEGVYPCKSVPGPRVVSRC